MIDKISEWAWNIPSIDEYWDSKLNGKSFKEQMEMIVGVKDKLLGEYLIEWLILKIRAGIGKPVIKQYTIYEGNKAKDVVWDIRDYETFVKFKNRHK